eukprot:4444906-Prymnesium_polylepis.2
MHRGQRREDARERRPRIKQRHNALDRLTKLGVRFRVALQQAHRALDRNVEHRKRVRDRRSETQDEDHTAIPNHRTQPVQEDLVE